MSFMSRADSASGSDKREKDRLAAHSIPGIPIPKTKKEKAKLRRMVGNSSAARRKQKEDAPRGWYARVEAKEEGKGE